MSKRLDEVRNFNGYKAALTGQSAPDALKKELESSVGIALKLKSRWSMGTGWEKAKIVMNGLALAGAGSILCVAITSGGNAAAAPGASESCAVLRLPNDVSPLTSSITSELLNPSERVRGAGWLAMDREIKVAPADLTEVSFSLAYNERNGSRQAEDDAALLEEQAAAVGVVGEVSLSGQQSAASELSVSVMYAMACTMSATAS